MAKEQDKLDFEGYRLPAEAKLVNCAGCKRLLLGRSMQAWLFRLSAARREELPPLAAGHMHGRPYCGACLAPSITRMDLGSGERLGKDMGGEGNGGWQDNALRDWEENEEGK